MKNILFVIESLHCGGAEKSLTTLLQNIDFKKFQVDLMLFTPSGEFEKFIPPEVNIIRNNQFSEISTTTQIIRRIYFFILKKVYKNTFHPAQQYWKAFNKSYKKTTKTYAIAIAYNQGFSSYYVSSKSFAEKKYAWLNTDYIKAGYNIDFDYGFYKDFNNIVCVSKENETSIKNALSSINKQIDTIVIKDITDVILVKKMSEEKIELPFVKNKTNILTVGRLAKAKGIHLAIEACELLLEQGLPIKWYVVGDGPERSRLEDLIKSKKLEKHFILLGFKENPYPFIKYCDIYAQTSLFEGLGLTVIEAATLQKPIVTTNFPTASTIITHKKTGIISEMKPQAIAKNIIYYIENKEFTSFVINNLSNIENNDKKKSLEKISKLLST